MAKRERKNLEQLSFWIPESLAREFREICDEKGVTYVSVLVRFLKGFITRERKKEKPE